MIKTAGNNFFEQDKIQEVLDRINIVDLISGYVNLKRAGNNHKGLCPFHSEKTPSFVVSEGKQMFHCFGCGAGGNAIKFYMEIESKSFPEAVRDLAEKNGIVVEEVNISPEEDKRKKNTKRYLAINKLAAEFFKHNLHNSPEGKKALEYLKKRQLTEELIEKFNLGWAPDEWQELKNFFNSKKISDEELYKLGLLSKNQDGTRYFDKFRGRVIFPIQDINGNFIAFGGRIIGEGEPKYLNSPDTPVYNKGRHLYALNIAKNEIRKKDFSLLVEGYMDVLICHQFGIENAAASLGTAFTPEQAKLLMRYSIECKIAYDGDEAGKKAGLRAFEILADTGMKAQAVQFPQGCDPDDFLLQYGRENFERLIDKAENPVIFKLNYLTPSRELSISEKNKIIGEISGDLFKINSTILRDYIVKEISVKLGLQEDLVRSELNLLYRNRKNKNINQTQTLKEVNNTAKKEKHYKKEHIFLLQKIKENPSLAEEAEKRGGACLFPEELKYVYLVFTNKEDCGTIDNLRNSYDQLISGILLQEFNYENENKAFFEILNNMCCLKIEKDFAEKQKQLKESEKKGDMKEIETILSEINEIIKNKDRIRKGLFN